MGSRALYRKSEAMQPVRQRRSELPYVPEVRSADSQSAPRANIAFPPFDQISVFPTKEPLKPAPRDGLLCKRADGFGSGSLEAQADLMAAHVVRNWSLGHSQPGANGTTCTCGGTCSRCAAGEAEKRSRSGGELRPLKAGAQAAVSTGLDHEEMQNRASLGQPLDPGIRQSMERNFGFDFSKVRIHADPYAAELAERLNARAFALGPNLFFGEKQFLPSTSEGRTLLAHELTHVVQQSGGAPAPQRQAAGSKRQNTNVDLARKRGKAMVVRVKTHGKLSKEARAKINSDLAFFEGAAKDAYIEEVKPALMAVTKSAGPATPVPPRSQTMEGLSAATLCGGGPCFTDDQIYGSQTAAAKSEEAQQDKDRDAKLNDLRSRMNGWRTEDQEFALHLLDNVLRRNLNPDPRGVSDFDRQPILDRLRKELEATDNKRKVVCEKSDRGWVKRVREKFENNDICVSWFENESSYGPNTLAHLERQLKIHRGAAQSAVEQVYWDVFDFRLLSDPAMIEQQAMASEWIGAAVGAAGALGEQVHPGEMTPGPVPPVEVKEPSTGGGGGTTEPPGGNSGGGPSRPPAQTIKASPPPPPQQTSRPGAPVPVTDVEVVKTNVNSPASIKRQSPGPHQTDWTVRGGTGKAPAAYRDSEGILHVSADHPLIGAPNRSGIPPVRPSGKTPPARTPSRTQPAPSSTPTRSRSDIGLEDTGKPPAPAKPAVDPKAKTPPAAPKDAPVPKGAPTGEAAAESKRGQAPRGHIDPPQAVSREVVENIRNRPRTVDPRRKGSGSNVNYTTDHEAHELAWKRLGGHGDSPPAFIYDNQVYLDPSRWKD